MAENTNKLEVSNTVQVLPSTQFQAQNMVPQELPTSATQGVVAVPVIGQEELPPPSSPTVHGNPATIKCKVCQAMINIEGKTNQCVVMCTVCNEATPLNVPPAGKRYVRCPCKCLLISDVNAIRITCARPTCRQMLTVSSQGTSRSLFSCVQCGKGFHFNNGSPSLVKCPYCQKLSIVGSGYPWRGAICLSLGILCLVAGVGVTVATFPSLPNSGTMSAILAVAFGVGFGFLVYGSIFCCVRKSTLIGPA